MGTDAGSTFARAVSARRDVEAGSARGGARTRAGGGGEIESQEICFVPDGDYAGFIDRYLEAKTQRIVCRAREKSSMPTAR